MIKYDFITNENGEAVCIIQKGTNKPIVLIGKEAVEIWDRFSTNEQDKLFIRDTTLGENYHNTKDDVRILNSIDKQYNVTIQNCNITVDTVAEFKRNHSMRLKPIARIAALATGVVIGVGTFVALTKTAGRDLKEEDLRNFTKESFINIEKIEKEIDDEIVNLVSPVDNEVPVASDNAVYIGDNKMTRELVSDVLKDLDNQELTNEETESLINSNQEINAEEVVENYNKDRIFTGYTGRVSDDINKGIQALDPNELKRISETTGISESLIIDILSQESSGATIANPAQIEFGTWGNKPINVFNYSTGKMEKIVLTTEKDRWVNQVDRIFNFNNKYDNIEFGMAILESFIQEFKNIPEAIQAYNMGPGNIRKFVNAAIKNGMITEDQADELANQLAYDIIERYAAKDGDTGRSYLANVSSHENDGDRPGLNDYSAKYRENDETVEIHAQFENEVTNNKTL